jgi:hypothetical protein
MKVRRPERMARVEYMVPFFLVRCCSIKFTDKIVSDSRVKTKREWLAVKKDRQVKECIEHRGR